MVSTIDSQSPSEPTDLRLDVGAEEDAVQLLEAADGHFAGVKSLALKSQIAKGKSGSSVFLVEAMDSPISDLKLQLQAEMERVLDNERLQTLISALSEAHEDPTLVGPAVNSLEARIRNLVEIYSDTPEHYRKLVDTFADCFGTEHRIVVKHLLPGISGPHYLKIHRNPKDVENLERLLSRKERIYQLMTPPADYALVKDRLMVLYRPAREAIHPGEVMSLIELARAHYPSVSKNLAQLAQLLENSFCDAQPQNFSPHNALKAMLRARRVDGSDNVQIRTVALASDMGMTPEHIDQVRTAQRLVVVGADAILPNPVAYLDHPEWWMGTLTKNILVPLDATHGDLHCENIICRRWKNEAEQHLPEIIDFDDPDEGPQSIFFDYLYLELDIILRLLPPVSLDNRRQLLNLMAVIMDGNIVPSSETRSIGLEANILDLLRPLRESCARLVEGSHREDYENAFWLTAVAVGLNYLRKRLKPEQRMLGWLYAAYALREALKYHELQHYLTDMATCQLAWIHITAGQAAPVTADPVLQRETYLSALVNRLDTITLTQLTEKTAQIGRVQLHDIYVPLQINIGINLEVVDQNLHDWWFVKLDNTQPIEGTNARLKQLFGDELNEAGTLQDAWREYLREMCDEQNILHTLPRPIDATQAAALSKRVVISGEPGSGKSTVLRYLALQMARALLSENPRNYFKNSKLFWPHEAYLPVYIEFGALVRAAFPNVKDSVYDPDNRSRFVDKFLQYLRTLPADYKPEYFEWLHEQLLDGRAMLFLDGLDEVPEFDRPERQRQIQEMITGLCEIYPHARVVISTRPHTLTTAGWTLKDFIYVQLVKLDPKNAEKLAKRLFMAALGRDEAVRQLNDFRVWTQGVPAEISTNPLFYSLMVAIWLNQGGAHTSKLATKGAVYRESVNTLIRRWTSPSNEKDQTRLQEIGLDERQLRQLLETLAFRTQSDGHEGDDSTFESGRIMTIVRRDLNMRSKVKYDLLADALAYRSGLIQDRGSEVLQFTHRSFQEHLAASYLANPAHFPKQIVASVRDNPLLWRNVMELLPDEIRLHDQDLWELIEELLSPQETTAQVVEDNPALYSVYYAIRILESQKSRIYQRIKECERERLTTHLVSLVSKGALTPVDRAEMGRVLAEYGDTRRGVGLTADGVPDIAWCFIPNGSVRMGRPGTPGRNAKTTVDAFSISRYPITVAQFKAFVDDGGYTNEEFWHDAGLAELHSEKWKHPKFWGKQSWHVLNHPVVGVSWYEAIAFCKWLSKKLDIEISLPTETQWEMAARGTDGRIYPHGDHFDSNRGNVAETRIGRTSAVGMFPSGASPFGVMDMVGNINEWCRSKWRNNFDEMERNGLEGPERRVVRGGSYFTEFALEDGIPREYRLPINDFDPHGTGFRIVTEVTESMRETQISQYIDVDPSSDGT